MWPALRKLRIWPKLDMNVYKLLMKTLGKTSLSTVVKYQPLYTFWKLISVDERL